MMMKRMFTFMLAILIAGCASRQPTVIPQNGQQPSGIYAGDRVEVITHDGRMLEFVVQRVDKSGLAGDTLFVYYSEMAGLTRLTADQSWTTVALGVGLVVLTVWALSYQAEADPFCLVCGEWRRKD